MRAGPLELDCRRGLAWIAGRPLALARSEFLLLRALMGRPGEVVSRGALAQAVWGPAAARGDRSVDPYVHRLRAKLRRAAAGESDAPPARGPSIEAVRGFGFRLTA